MVLFSRQSRQDGLGDRRGNCHDALCFESLRFSKFREIWREMMPSTSGKTVEFSLDFTSESPGGNK